MSLFPCLNNIIQSQNPWTVVLTPTRGDNGWRGLVAGLPEGSVCAGRTWRTPQGARVTFAIPGDRIPEGEFNLVLCGWGHRLSLKEVQQTKAWRGASCCRPVS
jgi:hypothetical protein